MKNDKLLGCKWPVLTNLKLIVIANLVALVGLMFISPTSLAAAVGLTASPTKVRLELQAGQSVTDSVTISNAGEQTIKVKAEVVPYQVVTENYEQDFNQQTPRTQLSRWVSFDKNEFVLEKGKNTKVFFKVDVPDSIPDGDQYAALFFTAEAMGDKSTIQSQTRLGILLYAKTDGETIEKGKIIPPEIPFWHFGNRLELKQRLENSGNTDFQAEVKTTVQTIFGKILFEEQRPEIDIISNTTRAIPIVWERVPLFGLFKVTIEPKLLDQQETFSDYVFFISPIVIVIILLLFVALILWAIYGKRKRSKPALGTKTFLLILGMSLTGLMVFPLSTARATDATIQAIVGEPLEPVVVTTPNDSQVVLTSPVTLQFEANYVTQLVIKRGGVILATIDRPFAANQSFSQSIDLVQGENDFVFEITGGSPSQTITRNYRLTYDPHGTTLSALATNRTSPALGGSVSDPSYKIIVEINGKTYNATNNGDGTWSLPADTIQPELSDGSYDVIVTTRRSDDSLIGQHTFLETLVIDTVAPTVSLETVQSDQRSPALEGTISEATSRILVTINGKTYNATNNGDGTWSLPADTIQPELASGTYEVEIRAIDLVGNETVLTKNFVVKAAGEFGFFLAPTTGYLRIGKFNLPSWALYLIIVGIITTIFVHKKRQTKKN